MLQTDVVQCFTDADRGGTVLYCCRQMMYSATNAAADTWETAVLLQTDEIYSTLEDNWDICSALRRQNAGTLCYTAAGRWGYGYCLTNIVNIWISHIILTTSPTISSSLINLPLPYSTSTSYTSRSKILNTKHTTLWSDQFWGWVRERGRSQAI